MLAHGAPLRVPAVSGKLDFEAELAVVIGSRTRHVTEADALTHVFGYACFNDATLRDYQRKTTQWTIGKNFDATGAFGPCLVTADELPPGCTGLHIEKPPQRPGDAERHHLRHGVRRGAHDLAAERMR